MNELGWVLFTVLFIYGVSYTLHHSEEASAVDKVIATIVIWSPLLVILGVLIAIFGGNALIVIGSICFWGLVVYVLYHLVPAKKKVTGESPGSGPQGVDNRRLGTPGNTHETRR